MDIISHNNQQISDLSVFTERNLLPVSDETHVHLFTFGALHPLLPEHRQKLSPDEQKRAARFVHKADAERYRLAHIALRTLLGASLQIPAEMLRFHTLTHGKPALSGASLEFNLSHSRNWLAIAVSGKTVGIDVEDGERLSQDDLLPLARQVFTPNEYAKLISLPLEQRKRAFLRAWTQKEAYLKALGTGLSLQPDTFEVAILPNEAPNLFAHPKGESEIKRWHFSEYFLENAHLSLTTQSAGILHIYNYASPKKIK
jgi:4'-phosphopantetheinyl transferase